MAVLCLLCDLLFEPEARGERGSGMESRSNKQTWKDNEMKVEWRDCTDRQKGRPRAP